MGNIGQKSGWDLKSEQALNVWREIGQDRQVQVEQSGVEVVSQRNGYIKNNDQTFIHLLQQCKQEARCVPSSSMFHGMALSEGQVNVVQTGRIKKPQTKGIGHFMDSWGGEG